MYHSWGVFHLTKNSGLNFRNFACQIEQHFPPGQTNLFLFPLEHISHQELLDKIVKDRNEVAVVSAISCFMWRSLTHTQNSTLP